MLNYFIALVKDIPKINKLEHTLNEKCYWFSGSRSLKNALSNNQIKHNEAQPCLAEILLLSNQLKEKFKKLPLSLQMEHVFNIRGYMDECPFWGDYRIESTTCQNIMINHLVVSYAEIILPQMENTKKNEFLDQLTVAIQKNRFSGVPSYEKDDLAIIAKWQLENELPNKLETKKTRKI